MKDEPVRVVFHLSQDPRFVGVLAGAVQFQAQQAGLDEHAGEQLARAAEDVCRETMALLLGNEEGPDVTLETFPDRMEVAIHCRGQLVPPAGLESFAVPDARGGSKGALNGLELLSRVDRILYDAENGVARTTLVKFLPSHR